MLWPPSMVTISVMVYSLYFKFRYDFICFRKSVTKRLELVLCWFMYQLLECPLWPGTALGTREKVVDRIWPNSHGIYILLGVLVSNCFYNRLPFSDLKPIMFYSSGVWKSKIGFSGLKILFLHTWVAFSIIFAHLSCFWYYFCTLELFLALFLHIWIAFGLFKGYLEQCFTGVWERHYWEADGREERIANM